MAHQERCNQEELEEEIFCASLKRDTLLLQGGVDSFPSSGLLGKSGEEEGRGQESEGVGG